MHPVYTKSLNRIQRREHWQRIIVDWRESGLKRKVFCEQHQIKLTDLRRWVYRLKRSNNKSKSGLVSQKIKSAVSFVPVEIASSAENLTTANLLQLQHQSGFSVTITTQTDEQLIKKLIRLFTEARC